MNIRFSSILIVIRNLQLKKKNRQLIEIKAFASNSFRLLTTFPWVPIYFIFPKRFLRCSSSIWVSWVAILLLELLEHELLYAINLSRYHYAAPISLHWILLLPDGRVRNETITADKSKSKWTIQAIVHRVWGQWNATSMLFRSRSKRLTGAHSWRKGGKLRKEREKSTFEHWNLKWEWMRKR